MKGMRIAIVEDERKLAATLADGLRAEGYEADVFYDGVSAEQKLLATPSPYSFLILDLMLPKKNGFEVCADLRREGIMLPTLVLTARDSVEDKIKMLDSGADDFLTKPFAFEELLARIRAIARRSAKDVPEKLVLGDIIANTSTRRVTRGKKDVELTPTEFDLLAFLAAHHGRAVSREEISTYLWDSADTALSNVVDVHISNLRKKLDDEYDKKIIRTVRGSGYAVEK
jgi:DNA-binding response OmpR family regulator